MKTGLSSCQGRTTSLAMLFGKRTRRGKPSLTCARSLTVIFTRSTGERSLTVIFTRSTGDLSLTVIFIRSTGERSLTIIFTLQESTEYECMSPRNRPRHQKSDF